MILTGQHVIQAWATDQADLEDVSGTTFKWHLDHTDPVLRLSLNSQEHGGSGSSGGSGGGSGSTLGSVIVDQTPTAIALITRHSTVNVALSTNENVRSVQLLVHKEGMPYWPQSRHMYFLSY